MEVLLPSDIPDVHLFRNLVIDIRLLMDLYFDYLTKEKAKHSKAIEPPVTYIIVKAIELSFFGSNNIKSQIGFCVCCFSDRGLIHMRRNLHAWLVWKEKYIIDVLPIDGMFGVSVPQAVFPNQNYVRFNPDNRSYTEKFNSNILRILDDRAAKLSYLFDELMSKVPQ